MYIAGLLNFISLSWSTIIPLVSDLILALFLILVGLLAARGLGKLAAMLGRLIQLDNGADQAGLKSLLDRGGIKKSASELLGDLVYWVVAFILFIGIAAFYDLAVFAALARMVSYMGIVFLAALILGIGIFFARLISGIILLVMANFELEGAKTVSRLIYLIVIIFSFLVALSELGIKASAFEPQIGVIIGAFGLAAAIAFGLGCKDMAADFLHNLFKGK